MKNYDECYFVNYDTYYDLNLYEIGCQKCPSDYSFGPIIRENYVLHYILNGCGVLHLDSHNYKVCAKQAFITPPLLPAAYQADNKDPWNYIWIHFNGEKVLDFMNSIGISKSQPLFLPTRFSPTLESYILNILHGKDQEYLCIGLLYHLFQEMINLSSTRPEPNYQNTNLKYIKDTINYISHKYSEPIKVQEIADHCGLDRSYLSKIFKQATNYSPHEYLLYFRMRKAKQLLKETEEPIQHVAYAVGYPDPFAFSKIFKKETSLSPSEYRIKHARKQAKRNSH